jgi:AraC-like DNA-binding protein
MRLTGLMPLWNSRYGWPVLSSMIEFQPWGIQIILWLARGIFEDTDIRNSSENAAVVIATKFNYLVDQFFTNKVRVDEYAELLNITANHLSQTIKIATGRTPKSTISQPRMDEAKYLMRYTTHDVASIPIVIISQNQRTLTIFLKSSGYTPLHSRKLMF